MILFLGILLLAAVGFQNAAPNTMASAKMTPAERIGEIMGLRALPAGFDARKYAGKLVGTHHDGRITEIRNIEEREACTVDGAQGNGETQGDCGLTEMCMTNGQCIECLDIKKPCSAKKGSAACRSSYGKNYCMLSCGWCDRPHFKFYKKSYENEKLKEQDLMCTVQILNNKIVSEKKSHMKDKYDCDNDDAKAMKICYAQKGTTITLFDNGDMKKNDDWTTIEVTQTLSGCEPIYTFQPKENNGEYTKNGVTVKWHEDIGGNGIDGKVSSFQYGRVTCNVDGDCPAGKVCTNKGTMNSACANCFDVKLTTKSYGSENSWALGTCSNNQAYTSGKEYTEKCCLAPGVYTLECKDSYGDGWHGGYIEIQGTQYCADFSGGSEHATQVTIVAEEGICINKDGDELCNSWTNLGYCTRSHAKYMRDNCPKSCGFCG